MPAPRKGLTATAIEPLVNQRVAEALAKQEANKNNGNHDGNVNGNINVKGDGNTNAGGVVPVAWACTYKDFLNCQPPNFKGTEGV
ncbi:hypothetical protein Tco_0264088, partial [Tanacetum coccineum]